jgi:hypothetical protein
MPAPRKNWSLIKEKKSSPSPPQRIGAKLLLPDSLRQKPTVPVWAIEITLKALLGRDNRKISSERAARILPHLEYMVAYLNEIEAQGVTLPEGMKEKLLMESVRLVLTIRPRRHSSDALKVHSSMVDLFLDKMKWPPRPLNDLAKYKLSLIQHLPEIFNELAHHQGCASQCPARSPNELEIKQKIWMVTNRTKLRDTIVSFYHGIDPNSLRGPRHRPRIRRRTYKI